MEVFDSILEMVVKIISPGAFFLGGWYSHLRRMNNNDRELTLFLFVSEDFDCSGC